MDLPASRALEILVSLIMRLPMSQAEQVGAQVAIDAIKDALPKPDQPEANK